VICVTALMLCITSNRQNMIIFADELILHPRTMNIKRIFGALLTVLGIVGLIYAAVLFLNSGNGERAIKTLVMFGVLGLLFFGTGISLVRTTKDES
jgi:hypothetical protein